MASRITLKKIEAAVCQHFKLKPPQLHTLSRERRLARPRQIVMFLAREMTANSLSQIGRYYSRHHTVVMDAERRVAALSLTKPKLAAHVQECRHRVSPAMKEAA